MPCYTREQSKLLGTYRPAQAHQAHLPHLKLFIPLSSKLAKVQTNCMPGSMLEGGDVVKTKCESDLGEARSLVEEADREKSTTKFHSTCQRHFSTGFCTT